MFARRIRHAALVGALHVVFIAVGSIQFSCLADAQDRILLRQTVTALRGGQWSFVREAQDAINGALSHCGAASIVPDGVFGRNSRAALIRLGDCPGFRDLAIGDGEANAGVLTDRLWTRLLPARPVPDAVERAHVLWLTHENTDYDTVEFNFTSTGEPQPNDKQSYLTWGPFGATVGHGREVQQILHRPEVETRLTGCFGREAGSIQTMIAAPDTEAGRLVRLAFLDPGRRSGWRDGFHCLGSLAGVRAAYDAFALDGEAWLHPAVRRLQALVGSGPVTAADFGFFVDLAMHMSISEARVAAARQALRHRTDDLGRRLSPAERRQTIGQTLVSLLSNQDEDRRGRNVVYYIDGLGIEALTPQEIEAWEHRSKIRASDVGLDDTPVSQ